MAVEPNVKSVHSLVLDAGPMIKGEPSISSLLQQCEELICSPAVIGEIRDQATRARLETSLKPFVQLRTPKQDSVRVIVDFAKKTGDFAVLSKTDIELLALAYEIECERNGGDWRLRNVPGQKRINGSAPTSKTSEQNNGDASKESIDISTADLNESEPRASIVDNTRPAEDLSTQPDEAGSDPDTAVITALTELSTTEDPNQDISKDTENTTGDHRDSVAQEVEDDSDGWITPSNIKRTQLEEDKAAASGAEEVKVMQVAMITTDFAMQNVLLQMNLNLLSPSLQRVRHIKTFVLRCHACFTIVRDMTKQFCPRCGGDTLTRVTCSTNHKGEFQLHFKKNFQWNNRGAKYSIPKPVHGASNHRVKGGGKGGWGNDLILSEDQKEYTRAVDSGRRAKQRDLMDEDYLPSILSGSRNGQGSRIKVGAGKHVNSKKR